LGPSRADREPGEVHRDRVTVERDDLVGDEDGKGVLGLARGIATEKVTSRQQRHEVLGVGHLPINVASWTIGATVKSGSSRRWLSTSLGASAGVGERRQSRDRTKRRISPTLASVGRGQDLSAPKYEQLKLHRLFEAAPSHGKLLLSQDLLGADLSNHDQVVRTRALDLEVDLRPRQQGAYRQLGQSPGFARESGEHGKVISRCAHSTYYAT
jgi:hypothetical protein